VVCPDNLKGGPEETLAVVDTFEESSDKVEAKDVEATLEATQAAVELQELTKETNLDNIGSLKDRYVDRQLVVRRR
jgi:hypothetical protein